MELSFISYENQGTKVTKRLQRQHVIRLKMKEKSSLKSNSLISTKRTVSWRMRTTPEGRTEDQEDLTRTQAVDNHKRLLDLANSHPKHIPPPSWLKLSEHLLYTIQSFIESTLSSSPEMKDGDVKTTNPIHPGRGLLPPDEIRKYKYALASAMSQGIPTSISVSLLNQGFQMIEECLRLKYWAFMGYTAELVVFSYIQQKPEIGRMLLRQIYRMACIVHCPGHPWAIWARCFYILLREYPINVLEAIQKVQAKAVESVLGRHNFHSVKWASGVYSVSYTFRGGLDHCSEEFNAHMDRFQHLISTAKDVDRTMYIRFMNEACHLLSNVGEDAQVEILLAEAPEIVDSYFTTGVEPIRLDALVVIMEKLGQSLHALGKYEGGKDVWSKTLLLARQVHGDDHPVSINAMMYLTKCLIGLGHDATAKAVEEETDRLLACYQLGSSFGGWNQDEEIMGLEEARNE